MNSLYNSVVNSERKTVPWEYFFLTNPLTEDQISEIKNAKIDRSENYINDGTRSGNEAGQGNKNHNLREYVTKDNVENYPYLYKLIQDMQSLKESKEIAKLLGRDDNFEGSYVRLEVLHDSHRFWLQPHCDIKEKLISSLIYINDTDEDENLGTDLYDMDLNLIDTVPFKHNVGYIFAGPDKWHGVEKGKTVKVERRGIQLNYVTFETDWPV